MTNLDLLLKQLRGGIGGLLRSVRSHLTMHPTEVRSLLDCEEMMARRVAAEVAFSGVELFRLPRRMRGLLLAYATNCPELLSFYVEIAERVSQCYARLERARFRVTHLQGGPEGAIRDSGFVIDMPKSAPINLN